MVKADSPPHRGADGDMVRFAKDFILTRAGGLKKDSQICLTDTVAEDGVSITHAYFPALATCCGFLEYMTDLHRGRINKSGWKEIVVWSGKYLPKPDYSDEIVRVLFDGFRHSVAHRGIATGIWLDRQNKGVIDRRVTWKLFEDDERPSCQLIEDVGNLTKDPPWPCPHTHRMHIHLKALAEDLYAGAVAYANDIAPDSELLKNFERAMQALYPRVQRK